MTTTTRIWQNVAVNATIRGITFSGGEPFLWAKELAAVGRCAVAAGLDVMTYSGYTMEKLAEMSKGDEGVRELLAVTRYLVDGPFVQEKRDITLRFRGSSNQHIWDLADWDGTEYPDKMPVMLDEAWC